MNKDLKPFTQVPFEKIFLDPNNPRIAPSPPPGYDDPLRIFDLEVQSKLLETVPPAYGPEKVKELQDAIEAQGWVPIDAILVWEHNLKKGHFVVVEGNTRYTVLTRIRQKLVRERAKLKTLEGKPLGISEANIVEQRGLVASLEEIVQDTNMLTVAPVNAITPEELKKRLPRLLGVRHISHAREWLPYATNLYMLSLYQDEWSKVHPEDDLQLEDSIVKRVAAMISQTPLETRRNIQSSFAFSRFKVKFSVTIQASVVAL